MELHDIFKEERKRLNISQADAADTMNNWGIDVSPATISRIEKGWVPSWPIVLGYLKIFGWKLSDLEKMMDDEMTPSQVPTTIGQYVPVVSWVQAGNWSESLPIDNHLQEKTFVTGKIPKNTFALRVSGDSMEDCQGKYHFPNGSLILVNPDATANVRDFVVAVDESTQEATFKQLIDDCGVQLLKPLNNQYPVIRPTATTVVKGVVFRNIDDRMIG